MLPPPPRDYIVRIPKQGESATAAVAADTSEEETIVYQLRGLVEPSTQEHESDQARENDPTTSDDTERRAIDDWTQFCAFTFRDKKPVPPPASYFARHYYNDPHRRADLIRVAVSTTAEDNRIVASCRVFVRQINSLANGQGQDRDEELQFQQSLVLVGGIGEVCTAPDHRRRGLAAELLQDATLCMKAIPNMRLSLLHSAPSFFPVYQKAGYVCSTSHWSQVTVDLTTLASSSSDDSPLLVRAAQFPMDTAQFTTIHQTYSERRFVGCIHRSKEYWEQYLAVELKDALWVLTKKDKPTSGNDNDESTILGWLSLRQRGDRYQVREFGCHCIDDVPMVFQHLMTHIQTQTNELSSTGDATPSPLSIPLHLPTFLLQEILSESATTATSLSGEKGNMHHCISDVRSDDDHGWMYKVLSPSDSQDGDADATTTSFLSDFLKKPHLIWPSDSF